MLHLSNYQIHSQIYESTNSIVYRGLRQIDKKPIILKLLRENYPTPQELTRYKQEYRLTHQLNIPGVIKAEEFIEYGNSFIIVFEDFGGESLKQLLQQNPFSIKECLQLGIKITDSLENIHQAGIIHKDINPTNIVYNPQTQQLKIIDFGIATLLNTENTNLKSPSVLEGTLAYISPEQTGRMNRSLDYRTDFYSLGVSLYELVTGKFPFETNDALELLHCHLAQQPSSVINYQLPTQETAILEILDKIIQKLMAKAAEERYQSAWGIKADLEKCLFQLETPEAIVSFILGEQDRCDRFSIPEKLYGREKEIETLLAAFETIAKQEEEISSKLILVSGYSGIGKSALVNELYKPITEARGYFISGKFDQYQRDIPYSAIIQAFSQLIRQLLTESTSSLQQWRDKLVSALTINGQIIIDVIPELELIIGTQQAATELPPQETQNRFNLFFKKFIQVFTQSKYPLVIFLDDLQWSDNDSLELIELLLSNSEQENILLIGAYRDNEVDINHHLSKSIKKLEKQRIEIINIHLTNLSLIDIQRLLAKTFNTSPEKTISLAKIIIKKTSGNPFFIREFIKFLFDNKLILYDNNFQNWQWNTKAIEQQNITDNVVELMTSKIQKYLMIQKKY